MSISLKLDLAIKAEYWLWAGQLQCLHQLSWIAKLNKTFELIFQEVLPSRNRPAEVGQQKDETLFLITTLIR